MVVNEDYENENEAYTSEILKRTSSKYNNLTDSFVLKSSNYEKQFNCIYSSRIGGIRALIEKKALEKWGIPAERLMNLNSNDGAKRAVVGTIYKRQELKPSILKEVSKQYQTVPPPPRTHFVSATDELILEDETQRVTLSGELDINLVVTGIVVAVLGVLQPNGVFVVEDYCFSEAECVSQHVQTVSEDKYLIILSGTELATNGNLLPLQLFIDWVTGWLGTAECQNVQSKIAHVLIAGNCIRSVPQKKPKYGETADNSADIAAVKELDNIITQLVENVDVDIMPGEYDPTNHTLPQQPLHRCLFPKATKFKTFRSVTNPHAFEIEDLLVVGTSGQPLVDIQRYSNLADPLDILEKTLEWGHLAPTAPDTLPCYPYSDKDPFILKQRPHIYFAANQPNFQTKIKAYNAGYNVRLICVPSFANSSSCVMINLRNLDCHTVSFNALN